MVGNVWNFDSLKVCIVSGEKRKMIFFRSDEEYREMLKMGMRIGKSVIFDDKTDKIENFF